MKTNNYTFRTESIDDILSFFQKVDTKLMNSHSYQTRTDPETLDMVVTFRTVKTLDELHGILDELQRVDGIHNSEKIKESLVIDNSPYRHTNTYQFKTDKLEVAELFLTAIEVHDYDKHLHQKLYTIIFESHFEVERIDKLTQSIVGIEELRKTLLLM